MRKRQINNMHGGYRGRGVTIDWHTTYKPSSNPPNPSMIQVDNKPLPPIIPPSDLQPPTNEPPPTTPPQIINKPVNKVSDGAIMAIVGLSAAAITTGTYIASKYMSGIVDERNRRALFPDDDDERYERQGLLADQKSRERDVAAFNRRENPIKASIHFPLRGGDEEEFDLSEEDQLSPILVNVLGNEPRSKYVAGKAPDINDYAFYDKRTGKIIPRSGAEKYFDVGL
jgi:hypothetical protein